MPKIFCSIKIMLSTTQHNEKQFFAIFSTKLMMKKHTNTFNVNLKNLTIEPLLKQDNPDRVSDPVRVIKVINGYSTTSILNILAASFNTSTLLPGNTK